MYTRYARLAIVMRISIDIATGNDKDRRFQTRAHQVRVKNYNTIRAILSIQLWQNHGFQYGTIWNN